MLRFMYSPQHHYESPRPRVRLPPVVYLALLAGGLAVGVAIGPAMLSSRIRRWFDSPNHYVIAAAFAFVCFVAAMVIGGPALVSTEEHWYRIGMLEEIGIFVAPLLLAWCASAFAWVELGWVGAIVCVFFAALWGLKPMYATPGSDAFWHDMNCVPYGTGIALLVVAPVIAYLGRKTKPAAPLAVGAGYPQYGAPPYAQPYPQQPYAQQPYAQQPYAQQPYGPPYPGPYAPPRG
ncbi:hypothetical protein BH09MYX1_BH09MYX1_55670 [soil metagenome]